jgi:hypothetical protein
VTNSTGPGFAAGGGPGQTAVSGVGGAGQTGFFGGAGLTGKGGYAAGPGVIGLGGNGPGTTGSGGEFTGGGKPGDGLQGGDGVEAIPGSDGGVGIYAWSGHNYASGTNTVAGTFNGDVNVIGNLSKSGGSFKIDHPVDPAHKYLYHSFVESPDMMNIYNGNVITDATGRAVVSLPDWFEALNRDFRYQLTAIGQPAQAWVASEIFNHSFVIQTDKPNIKVSWQVTGIRQDAWANAHRIPTEVDKPTADQDHYLSPELFGHAGEPSIPELHHARPQVSEQP